MPSTDQPFIDAGMTRQVSARSRWQFEIGFAFITLLAIAVTLSIVGRHAGWPDNDEFTSQAFETQIYAAHFRQLDFFPIWSSSDAFGLGTPLPLYYHKVFFAVSGVAFLLLGNVKATLVLSLGLFMLVGVYGMRAALGVITRRRLLITVGALSFIFTNYAFTDWLVRGDFAEFSAMMIVPWLLWWCLRLVKVGTASFAIIPIMLLLVLAHNLTALSSIIVLLAALATCLVVGGLSSLQKVGRRLVISVVAVAVILSPLILAEVRFNRYYSPASKATQGPFRASRNFVAAGDYFWNSGFRWLTDYASRTPSRPNSLAVQIDFAIWIPIALALPILLVVFLRRRHSFTASTSAPVMVFVFGALAVYMFFQFPVSRPLYKIISPLEILQFPWRMMVFITPLGVLAAVMLGDALFDRTALRSPAFSPVLSLAWLASFVALSPLFATFQNYGFLSNAILVAPRYQTFGQPPLLYAAEYLPQIKKESSFATLATYQGLLATHRLTEPLPGGNKATARGGGPGTRRATTCTVVEPKKTKFEALKIQLTVTCDRATKLALPISYNAYTTITATNTRGGSRPVSYLHIPNDPRIIVEVSSTKPEHLVITLPSLFKVLF
jgi:hypothetical protein